MSFENFRAIILVKKICLPDARLISDADWKVTQIFFSDREQFITSQIAKAVQKLHRNDIVIYNKQHQPQTLAAFSDEADKFKVNNAN